MTHPQYLVVVRYLHSGHIENHLCTCRSIAEVELKDAFRLSAQTGIDAQAYRLVPVEMRDGVLVEGGE